MQLPTCFTLFATSNPASASDMAPTQLYIVLAITVATLSWLLGPEKNFNGLSGREVAAAGALVVVECLHLWMYSFLPDLMNTILHGAAVAGWLIATGWIFLRRWKQAKGLI